MIPIITDTTGRLLRSFKNNLDETPGKHSSEELQNKVILETAHILKTTNFKRIFHKLLWTKPQGQGWNLARRHMLQHGVKINKYYG
jgi:hypothetical protein